jgi:5'-methylthioadenosine phosphorylase
VNKVMVGVIGGSGLGQALGSVGKGRAVRVKTPFGSPSGPITLTEVDGVPVALLARHGPGHVFNPSRVPVRANLFALKVLGVTHVLASTAVGSLKEEIAPGHLVIPDQLIDRTNGRERTFFDELAVHVELASPFCSTLRRILLECSAGSGLRVHPKGTYVCMEGPQFSTRAESDLHRSWGADLIGMTALPEAKLAREAELCYAIVALPTDYDCWRPHPSEVDKHALLKEIIQNLKTSTEMALALIRRALPAIGGLREPCSCQSALELGLWTDKAHIPATTLQRLAPLLGKYLPAVPARKR